MRYEMKISETESLINIKLFISDIVEGIKRKEVLLMNYFSAKKSFTLSLWTITSLYEYLPVTGSFTGFTTLTKSLPEPTLAALCATFAFFETLAIFYYYLISL